MLRATAVPVCGRSPRGRLYSGTARRDGAELSPELAVDRLPDPDDAEPLEEPPLPLRDVLEPELAPLRVRVRCSLARIGASNDPRDQAAGVSDVPIALPPENPDTAPPDPLDPDDEELDPLSLRDTAEPPLLSPPLRGADCPVVLPLEVRSCAHAGNPAALTPTARTRVPNNF